MKMSVVVENDSTKKEFSVEVPDAITAEMLDAINATIRREFGIPEPQRLTPQPITIYRDWYVYPYHRDTAPYRPYWYASGVTTNAAPTMGAQFADALRSMGTAKMNTPTETFSVNVRNVE